MDFKKEDLIKSPINYSGGKYRLLKSILPLFPNKIDTFIDLFSGSCTVGININAKQIIFNDYINYIPELFNVWKEKSIEEINNHIDKRIEEFKLSGLNKQGFEDFRRYYNETKNIEDLFVLLCHSFNFQMRFNNSHQYNSSFGKEASTMNNNIRNNVNKFVKSIKDKDTKFLNKDFRDIDLTNLTDKDFVYCDSPYLISGAVYQDGKRGFKGWNQQDDIDLMELLDSLHNKKIKFAMSNMLYSKGKSNDILIEWAKKYTVNYLKMNYNSSNYQRDRDNKDVEVLITNY
jgi:DNA adenine methylase Dam